ncbi:hypothetical protein H7X46_07790 [Pseudonocardia sp. C8]|uniref:hypothetical protein n=1 Tax=Pseudonocardia sp. C8 TaxID=2762759 RepID=UPI001642DB68|nr:hypothetical protein [Pseudonocardia sp. C8]MBC3190963.1 hypothetical protein [Pseudonocardia sp. C8]
MPDPVITAGFALSRRLRTAAHAAQSAETTEWIDREQQAIDALRALAAFLAHHAGSPVARAITGTFTATGVNRDGDRNAAPDSAVSVPVPAPRVRDHGTDPDHRSPRRPHRPRG